MPPSLYQLKHLNEQIDGAKSEVSLLEPARSLLRSIPVLLCRSGLLISPEKTEIGQGPLARWQCSASASLKSLLMGKSHEISSFKKIYIFLI